MKNIQEIKGKRIYLKLLTKENASPVYCSWLNDPEVTKYLKTKKATIARLKKYIQEKNENLNCLFLGIFFKKNKKHIGNIKLEPIDFRKKKATIGIMIGDKNYWGKGLATESLKLLVDYGFHKLNLKEVNLGVVSENKAAIKIYQKAGFKINKIEKKSIHRNNKLFDRIIMKIKK